MLTFTTERGRKGDTRYYLRTVEIKDYYVMINYNIRAYEDIRKITTGSRDTYITGCLLNYPCVKVNYELIVACLSKQKNSVHT